MVMGGVQGSRRVRGRLVLGIMCMARFKLFGAYAGLGF